ncbi:MAG: helix-turn-helix domain-containing protein [Chloroflexi bacterium]|nr:helix-turn-helix domain-containing protein [Chloroflexota bacterium]
MNETVKGEPQMTVDELPATRRNGARHTRSKCCTGHDRVSPVDPATAASLGAALSSDPGEAAEPPLWTAQMSVEHKLRIALDMLRRDLVSSLIEGTFTNHQDILEKAAFLGIEQLPNLALVADIDHFAALVRGRDDGEQEALKRSVLEAIETSVAHLSSALVSQLMGDEFAILVCLDSSRDAWRIREEAVNLAEHIRNSVRQHGLCTVTIGVGSHCRSLYDIAKSVREARRAVSARHSYLDDQNQVIAADEVAIDEYAHKTPRHYDRYPWDIERRLLERVQVSDREGAFVILDELMCTLASRYSTSHNAFKAHVFDLVAMLSRAALEVAPEIDVMLGSNVELAEALTKANSHAETRLLLQRFIHQLLYATAQSRTSARQHIVRTAKRYISDNYSRNISLEEVAESVHLSPFYFSHLFAQEAGCTFRDFVTSARIKAAKKALLEQRLSLKEVATQAGYGDVGYFGRVFKRVEGVTPRQFVLNTKRMSVALTQPHQYSTSPDEDSVGGNPSCR